MQRQIADDHGVFGANSFAFLAWHYNSLINNKQITIAPSPHHASITPLLTKQIEPKA